MNTPNSIHDGFMMECLELAGNGRVKVGNGAMVGAVLVSQNKIIAQGFHAKFGSPHAEAALLEAYDGPIGVDDLLYVNLEPCCHQGKMPPCTEVIIRRGIKNVCFGMLDPDPRVAGKGIAQLRGAGVNVIGPISRASCEYFNRGFVSLRTKGRPWITLKSARTRCGQIANPDGFPLKITTAEQDRWSHTFFRARHDAIVVGVGTIVSDNPQLNTRLSASAASDGQARSAQRLMQINEKIQEPWVVVLDPHLRVPMNATVVSTIDAQRTIVLCDQDASEDKAALLRIRGVRVAKITCSGGTFDLSEAMSLLAAPDGDFHGIGSVLVEGGSRTWQRFRDAGLVDEEVTLMGEE